MTSDNAGIELLVEEYFLGMYEGSAERLRAIFHPQCWLYGERKGDKREFPVATFLDYVKGAPVPKTAGEAFDMKIVNISRTGPVAVVEVEDLYQGGHFTDYLTCMETADGWKIVNKAFFSAD
jgi:hypothetical protein